MDDICAHITDVVANSVSAGAKKVFIFLEKSTIKNALHLKITDNGKGMDEETAKKVVDPFFSTKTGRKVGLGIPLLKGTAETCGGYFNLKSALGEGTEIDVFFTLDHPDLPPIGNLKDTILILTVSNPEVDFLFNIKNDVINFIFDTEEIKGLLDGVPINSPEVIKFLTNYLDEHLNFI
ncbi:MAG TPA: ATP-binding protein [Syntrophorhabdaceae bacterium]|nr:ATP-binding protein [Syntrophorhabdaceae bacterium]HQH42557.1 ATP-binding protein [Syntrophorhabdaceae bacterium]HRV22735.1 ATP-binding protein [Syntrophorhabdaceae bacterium]